MHVPFNGMPSLADAYANIVCADNSTGTTLTLALSTLTTRDNNTLHIRTTRVCLVCYGESASPTRTPSFG